MSSELSGAPKQIWPSTDSLDALIAGPDNHAVRFENEHVRVVHPRILLGRLFPCLVIAGRACCSF